MHTPEMPYPFTFRVMSEDGLCSAFEIDLVAVIGPDLEVDGGWLPCGFRADGIPIEEASVVGESQISAFLWFLMAHHKAEIGAAWRLHLAKYAHLKVVANA